MVPEFLSTKTIHLIDLKIKCYTYRMGCEIVRGENMNKEEIENQLNALVKGDLEELVIQKVDFLLFLEVWNNHPHKKSFVGEAQLRGEIIYRYKNEPENEI